MTREILPFAASDISALARSLHRELRAINDMPGHVQLLNMLARSAGFRNYQHLKAQHDARDRLAQPPATPDTVDHLLVERAARHFNADGTLVRWPARASHQALCLWALWSRMPTGKSFAEAEMNDMLRGWHSFGDHALLRRALFNAGLVSRSRSGSDYRRIEQLPPPEALALIRHIETRLPG